MTILLKEVEEVAKLAKLKFNDEERQKLQMELDGIVINMNKADELDMINPEPQVNLNEPVENILSKDEAGKSIALEPAMKNVKQETDDITEVKKVVNN